MIKNTYSYIKPALQNLERHLEKRNSILRKLQKPLFKDIVNFIRNYRTNSGKGYVVAPMGSGKTVIFAELVEAIGQRAIIAVPTIQLLYQTQEEFAEFAPIIRTGLVYHEKHELDADVIIITHASLVSNIKSGKLKPTDFNWLILDEVHEMLSNPRMKIAAAFKHAVTIGFTATDKYDEEKEVARMLPTEIHRITIVEGVEGGLLCPFSVIIAKTTTSLANVKSIANEYSKRDLERAVNIEARNRSAVALYEKTPFFRGKSLMCHCVSTNHADAVAKKFRKNGWKAAAVHYKVNSKKREKLIEQFRSGELTILCDVNQLTRGFNAPIVSICFNLDPTRSVVRATQRVRNLRIDTNNRDKFAVIVEFLDKDFNKKTPPVTFDRIVSNKAIVVPSSWKRNKKLRTIQTQLLPKIKLIGLTVHTKANEVLRVTKAILRRQKETWFSEIEIRNFFMKKKFKTMAEYNSNLEDRCPHSVDFPRIYNKTFGEVIYGKHGKIHNWPSEEDLKKTFSLKKFKSSRDYDTNRPNGYPSSRYFEKIYGKTYSEMIHGRKYYQNIKWVSKKQVVSFFKKEKLKSISDYNKKRPKNYPASGMFPSIYGGTFRQVIPIGKKWLTEREIKKVILAGRFKNDKDYNKKRPMLCPHTASFPAIYRKTYSELLYGKKAEVWPDETEVKKFLKKNKIKNQLEYDHKRPKKKLPKSSGFPRIYGKTFGEMLHGRFDARKKV